MKNLNLLKMLFVFVCSFVLMAIGCGSTEVDYDKILNEAVTKIEVKSEVTESFGLVSSVTVSDNQVNIIWELDGKEVTKVDVVRTEEDQTLVLTATYKLTINEETKELKKTYQVKVLKKEVIIEVNKEELVDKALAQIAFESVIDKNIELLDKVIVEEKEVSLEYEISSDAISKEGIIKDLLIDEKVTIKCTAKYEDVEKSKSFEITVKGLGDENILEEIKAEMTEKLFTNVTGDIDLKETYTYLEKELQVKYQFSKDLISENGKVVIPESDQELDVVVTITCGGKDYTIEIKDVKVLSYESQLQEAYNAIEMPKEINDSIQLITKYKNVVIEWSTDNSRVLTSEGELKYVKEPVEVEFSALLILSVGDEEFFYDAFYTILCKPYAAERRLALAQEQIQVPQEVTSNMTLTNEFKYDVTGTWSSSNPEIISNIGLVNQTEKDVQVELALQLVCDGITKDLTFTVTVKKADLDGCEKYFGGHNLLDRAVNFDSKGFNNVELKGDRLELKDGALEGYYESNTFKVRDFFCLVGSYSCITSTNATGELLVSIRVGENWSKYITYGEWGLGLNNLYYNDSDSVAKLNTDEIFSVGGDADAIKYRFVMRRKDASVESPKLLLVAFAIEMNNYSYPIDTTDLPTQKDHDLPKLYQHDVPVIGGSICSATTTTMLLKNKGFDFSNKGYAYEHEFMANMVADRGHNNPTYGNWSYNMIAAGAFGVEAYVARMYSWEELKEYLATNGPVGASIAGNFGIYSTGGHLIVVRGYREENGQTYVICNDPNVKSVYYEVTLSIFMNAWRNVVYIVE